jgi:hypothetical protein
MKIVDVKENAVPFHTLPQGSICKILWSDGSKPTYAIKIQEIEADCGCSIYNVIDLTDGEPFECGSQQPAILLDAELRIL